MAKSLDFLQHLIRNGCGRLLFSSSAAIYEVAADLSVDESSPLAPASPYARTKAVCEGMFADIAAAEPVRSSRCATSTRSAPIPQLRTGLQTRYPTHAVGKLIEAHAAGQPFRVHRHGLPDQGRHRGQGLHPRLGPGLGARRRAAEVRRGPRRCQLDRHQPGHRDRHDGARAGRGLQHRGGPAGRRPSMRRDGRATRPAVTPAATGPGTARAGRPSHTIADGIRDSLRWAEVRDQVLALERMSEPSEPLDRASRAPCMHKPVQIAAVRPPKASDVFPVFSTRSGYIPGRARS